MILFYIAAGVPTSWMLTSIFGNAYGIASHAASSWAETQQRPAFIVSIDEESMQVERKDLFWPESEDTRYVQPDRLPILQRMRSRISITEDEERIAAEALRSSLVEVGYLVSDSEWHRRRPSDVLVSKRFQEYFAADKAAREAGEDLAFDPRYIMMMPAPDDYVPPYGLVDGRATAVGNAPPVPDNLASLPDQEQVARLLNSGWNFDETLVHMGPIQID